MGYQLADGTKLQEGVAWTSPDGIQRPSNWLTLSTARDRELLGITFVQDASTYHDQRFYAGSTAKPLDDEPLVDEEGNDTGIVSAGLKSQWKAKQDQIAAGTLALSDWRVTKAKETGTNIPSVWKTYRAAVRTACNTRQAEIDACADVAALKELLFGSAQIQQTDDDGNGVVDDDGNFVMIDNPNLATPWPDPVE